MHFLKAITLAALMGTAAINPAMAGKADDTLRVAFVEEILELDYNYTTQARIHHHR